MNKPLLFITLLLFWMISPVFSSPDASSLNNQKEVLLINSYHYGYSWTDEITESIIKTLSNENVKVYVEYLDTKRNYGADYDELLISMFKLKHEKHQFDLVITSDNAAFDFYKKYGKDLFKELPHVFCGVNFLKEEMLVDMNFSTGVNEKADIYSNLSLINKIHTNCDKIVIITDNTITGKEVQLELQNLKKTFDKDIELELVCDISIDKLGRKLSKLNENTIVLYTFFLRDNMGKHFEYDESAQYISKKSSVPVYSAWDFNFGHGVLGGYMVEAEEQGTAAALQSIEILKGTDVAKVPILWSILTRPVFDYRELEAEQINMDALPEGAKLMYEPESFFYRYRVLIRNTIIAFVLLSIVIIILFVAYIKVRRSRQLIFLSKERLRTTLDSIGDGVISTDKEGRIERLNPVAETLTAWTTQEAKGKPLTEVFDIVNAHTRKIASDPVARVIKENKIVGLANHTILISKDRKEYHIADSAAPIQNKEGELNGVVLVFRDVSADYKAEEAIRESENKYRSLFETMKQGVVYQNLDGKIVLVNQSAEQILGIELEDSKGKNFGELDLQPINEAGDSLNLESFPSIISLINGEELRNNVIGIINKQENKRRWVNINAIPQYKDNQDSPYQVYITLEDITDRKNSELALQKSEERFKLAVDGARDGVWDWNIETNEVYHSNQFAQMLGYEPNEIEYNSQSWFELYHPDDLERAHQHIDDYLKGRTSIYDATYRLKTKDNKYRWINVRGKCLFNEKGKPSRFIGFNSDVSDIIEVKEQMAKLSKAVEQSPVAVIITNKEGVIEYVNPRFADITGYNINEAVGRTTEILESGEHSKEFFDDFWETIKTGNDWFGEFLNKRKSGELYWAKSSISPIFNGKGEITHYISVMEDATSKKQLLSDLEEAKVKSEESNRLKSIFLANLSHEIRTPMNGILGFASLLREPNLEKTKLIRFVDVIEKSGHRMLNLINDLIEISKLEAGQAELLETEVDIKSLMKDIFVFFKPDIDAKSLDFKIDCTYSEDANIIRADKLKLEQIISNLMSNAIKFTKKGELVLGCRRKDGYITFFVKDSGIGVPKEMHDKIFDRFTQVEDTPLREEEGIGLGLAISKSFADLMSGKIWVESEPGKGATFFLRFPLVPIKKKKTVHSDVKVKMVSDHHTVLIAEDDMVSYQFLKEILSKTNLILIHAANGKEVVQFMEENEFIDLVLMDIKMPRMNGWEAIKRIKMINDQIPIIAQTAYATPNDREKAMQAGCVDFISKPVNGKELIEKINKHLV